MTLPETPKRVELIFEGVPVAKQRPRFCRSTGLVYDPMKAEALRLAKEAKAQYDGFPIEGAVGLLATYVFPVPESWSRKKKAMALSGDISPTTKPDLDNLVKMVDVLNGIAFTDDKQIVSIQAIKIYGLVPRTIITVYPKCRPRISE